MGKKNLKEDEKDAIAQFLVLNSEKLVPMKGKISEAARKWNVTRKTVWLWWTRAKKKLADGELIHLRSGKLGNTNHPKIIIDKEKVKNMPKKNRASIEKLAKKLGVGYGTVQRWVKAGIVKKHTNAIHPSLTDSNKLERLIFSLASTFVDITQNKIKFLDMSLQVHIDEKWFYITRTTERYYIIPEEDVPYRACQSKRFITKVMFMCAVSRPVYGDNGEMIFDGKIGIFPFLEEIPAARNSKNRVAGTLETKPTNSITKEVIKGCLIDKIIPAIKSKWPQNASKDIFIQQDNARPHVKDNDPEFRAAASSDGFNIHLVFQPPNSPDLNINDLGFFSALQTLQHEKAANTVLELVKNVEDAFVELHPKKLNFNFLTLQTIMVEIMLTKGHNNFTIPHMRKRVLERLGILPRDIFVDEELVRQCLHYLDDQGQGSALDYLRVQLQQLPQMEEVTEDATMQ